MNFLEELKWRGLVKDVTDYDGLLRQLDKPTTVYCGFDPTADSLHVGHLQQIILLRRYQNAGHRPIALCGGFTGMIGDPRPTSERRLLTYEEVTYNVGCIKRQLARFLSFEGDRAAVMENNDHWLGEMQLLDYLRSYGKLFNIAYMLQKDTIKKRLDTGLSYTEFSYTILQAMDFLQLLERYDCRIQIGGSDQWGNLTSGMELIRKVKGENTKVWGITSPLITKSDGSKFGKSEGKNIWLDPQRTSAYEFYQFWFNTPDADIVDYLKRLSMRSVEAIKALAECVEKEPEKRAAQRALAEELTAIVHGEEGLAQARRITDTFFSGNIMELSAEELRIVLADAPRAVVDEGTLIIDALVSAAVSGSKSEARKLMQQGAVSLNGAKTTDLAAVISRADTIDGTFAILRKGRRNYIVVELRP
ncbi:MAG: tyrosine--tRNA ligase [Bulleidia sp.]